MHDQLSLFGVKENNLKNLDLSIQHDSFTVITGVSGSGKSTLAFDTIYAEGGRRYIETFSPYTRQFLDRLQRPDVISISGVRPALALEQRNRVTSSRSTVGTVTEINDYLKIVWSHLSLLHCEKCNSPVIRETPHVVGLRAIELAKKHRTELLLVCFPVHLHGDASFDSIRTTLLTEGHIRFFDHDNQRVGRIEDLQELPVNGQLTVLVDRIKISNDKKLEHQTLSRVRASASQAYAFGKGELHCLFLDSPKAAPTHTEQFTEQLRCSTRNTQYPPPRPSLFSFNSPLGACPTCTGFGKVLTLDPELCIPDVSKTIAEGAVACWNTDATTRIFARFRTFCQEQDIPMDVPWKKLSPQHKKAVLSGTGESAFRGLQGWFKRLERKRHRMHVRVLLSRYRSEFICPDCDGTRLTPPALRYLVLGRTLPELWREPVTEVLAFAEQLAEHAAGDEVTEIAVGEIISRLRYLVEIGLPYLTLDRQSRSLSGGESQRVNLTSILGSRLVNTMLVLDEPTIGLHPKDTERLISTIYNLRDRGNTLVVVEHDGEVIRAADSVVDLGPRAGSNGGQVVYQGSVDQIGKEKRSLTGKYLTGNPEAKTRAVRNLRTGKKSIRIKNAHANNLNNLDIEIPLGGLVLLTGASGSGKSTLLTSCLHDPYRKLQQGFSPGDLKRSKHTHIDSLLGCNAIDDIVLIDQTPIGKSPRSNPGTYSKAWDVIRECFAETAAAERLGLSKSAFSFNVDGGRCPTCKGAGSIKVEMQFLADVFVPCEACGGYRFQDSVLGVRFAGKNVIEFLDMTLTEALELFQDHGDASHQKKIKTALQPLVDLGLGYLQLGHPLNTVSGGEAQRIKLASYLKPSVKERCLFILDEPTTGLHPHNVVDLLSTFDKLIDYGHSLVCIEHNLDVIAHADWIIDLGPEGGALGGQVVASGPPTEVAKKAPKLQDSSTAQYLANYFKPSKNPAIPLRRKVNKSAHTASATTDNPIKVVGAREHNLRNVSIEVPQNKLIAITGVSGSGKSTLAFDIIFAEGQRRYIDCLSPYARQYIKQLAAAEVDQLIGIPPTIAISQKTAPPMGISTVATTTEIYQYLRLLFAKVGTQHCVYDNQPITSRSTDAIVQGIADRFGKKRILLFAPVVSGRKGYYNDLFNRALRAEITQARIDGELVTLETDLRLERHKLHWISLSVASLSKPKANSEILRQAVEQCLVLGNGVVEVYEDDIYREPTLFSVDRVCPECSTGYRELDPQDFSFRSARGVCEECGGRGYTTDKRNDRNRAICESCNGARIAAIGQHVYLDGKSIHELCSMSASQLLDFFKSFKYDSRLESVVEPILHELTALLETVVSVGLDYLILDRDASTVSGGEAQRLRLAKALGSPLTGVCYVLDEPSIGLHSQDHAQLMDTLIELRDAGNTVLIVEHDEDTIRAADHVIDVGPYGGRDGGHIVFEGSVAELEQSETSLTGQALRARTKAEGKLPSSGVRKAEGHISLRGATANTLKNVDVKFPINQLTVVCGVSGSGKSSLVHSTLVPAVVESFEGEKERAKFYDRTWKSIDGLESFERLIEIDQSPVGKTSTSAPVSYLKIFDLMRKVYAELPEAKARGWSASHFSFNTGKGRCAECNGRGQIVIPMSFLPDATTRCERCNGLRYDEETLEIEYQGCSLGSLLQKTFAEVHEVFTHHKKIRRALDYVMDLGLGYLSIGQATHTLSGGEAQRLKIARELGLREASNTIYLLDEPTIGLHMIDVERLRNVIQRLIDRGNTVVVIEHNLDMIRSADFLIEMGPGPGEAGGQVLFSGTPAQLLKSRATTPTKNFIGPQLRTAKVSNSKRS